MLDMLRTSSVIALAGTLVVVTACKSDPEPGGDPPPAGSGSGSASGAGGTMRSGFGASLGADLAMGSNGSAIAGSAGSAAPATAVGSAAPVAVGSAATVAVGSAAVTAPIVATGSATATAPITATGSAAATGSATAVKPPPVDHVAVKMSPELAAIKFELLPNWKRDVVEGASFTLNVDPPSGGPTKQFTFYYAYDDASAPTDRDAYMKWLGDQGLLTVTLNRQRGAAWYLEGTDGHGPAFRYLVNYGGKHLICFGPLYKDADSAKLGDIRDEVVMQAKKICESIGL
jgi:hypothetical protein